MARYSDMRKKEHAFQTIEKDMKSDKIPNVLLLCGEEQYLVHWAVEQLIKTYVNPACQALDVTSISPEDFALSKMKESCETLSMLSQRRVTLLPDFPPAAGEKAQNITPAMEEELLAYLPDLPNSCLLIMTAKPQEGRGKKKSKLASAVEKAGKVYDFTALQPGHLRAFVEKRLRDAGKTCRSSVLDMFIEGSGYGNKEMQYNLYNLENDIKKIVAHSTETEIVPSDVAMTISANPELNVFAMLDAVSNNQKGEAYRLLHNLLQDGQGVYALLALLVSQMELILQVKEMSQEGMRLPEIQKKLGIHEFRVKKALRVKDKYGEETLKRILEKAYQVDGNIKTGFLDQRLALELFLAGL